MTGLVVISINLERSIEMKIEKRILRGKLKGWTIRKSKYGWYDLYSNNGISQTQGKNTFEEIKTIVKNLSK